VKSYESNWVFHHFAFLPRETSDVWHSYSSFTLLWCVPNVAKQRRSRICLCPHCTFSSLW
jgi:hypothetical protein